MGFPAHSRLLLAILVGTFLLFPASLAAQRPQTREGFWIGFGVGQGNLMWDCDGCTTQDHGGPTGFETGFRHTGGTIQLGITFH